MAKQLWKKNILIMWSCLLENARLTGHFSMLLHILEDYTLQILCCHLHKIANEEGKLEGLPYNRALRDEDGDVYDVVAGTFMIVGLGEEDFSSLDEKYQQKYGELFGTPERFIPINGGLCVVPMEEPIPQIPEKQHKPKQKSHDREAR